MSVFEFNHKTYRIVEDNIGELVDGCQKCAFYNDIGLCVEVDGGSTGRVRCSDANHHYYEEVPAQPA